MDNINWSVKIQNVKSYIEQDETLLTKTGYNPDEYGPLTYNQETYVRSIQGLRKMLTEYEFYHKRQLLYKQFSPKR